MIKDKFFKAVEYRTITFFGNNFTELVAVFSDSDSKEALVSFDYLQKAALNSQSKEREELSNSGIRYVRQIEKAAREWVYEDLRTEIAGKERFKPQLECLSDFDKETKLHIVMPNDMTPWQYEQRKNTACRIGAILDEIGSSKNHEVLKLKEDYVRLVKVYSTRSLNSAITLR